MTEASENDLVRVRAQVMCRDEGTGGWMALGGGGLADVMVGKRPAHQPRATGTGDGNGEATSSSTSAPTHEYYIHGKRISDNMVVLECTIKKDFQYNKVMPTFHHWFTDEKRFGLTFQTAADARAFDKGVRTAVEELLDGFGGAWPTVHTYKKYKTEPKEEDEENNIFECLNLPTDSLSSSENSTASRARRRDDLIQTPILSAITLPTHDSMKQYEVQYEDKLGLDEDPERCHYVHLSTVHEYTYPQVGPGGIISSEKSSPNTKPPLLKRDSGSIKKCSYSGPPPLPDKKPAETFQARLKCKHCHEWYLESANRAGSCEYAPDCCRTFVDKVSCIACAQCFVYHCISEPEGENASRPCACAQPHRECVLRWLGITLLSVLIPCLWCYVPLKCFHRAARAAHVAGGQHAPAHTHAHANIRARDAYKATPLIKRGPRDVIDAAPTLTCDVTEPARNPPDPIDCQRQRAQLLREN